MASERTLREAAVRLGLTQPALTHAIQQLESELGVVLFERGRKGISLSPAGISFKTEMEALIRIHGDRIDRSLRSPSLVPIRLGFNSFIGAKHIMPWLEKNNDGGFPLHIYSNRSISLHEAVAKGQLDFAFVTWTSVPKHIQSEEVYKDKVAVVGLKRKFSHITRAKTLKDLRNEVWVHNPKPQYFWTESLPRHNSAWVTGDSTGLRDIILSGGAIGEVQLDIFTEQELKRLAIAPVKTPHQNVRMYAIYEELKPAAATLLQKIVTTMRESVRNSKIHNIKTF